MKHNWIIYLFAILMIGILMGCQPTISPESESQPLPKGDLLNSTREIIGETAVSPTNEPPPSSTADRTIRPTPNSLPAGAEFVPIIDQPSENIEPIPDNFLDLIAAEMQKKTGLSSENYEFVHAEFVTWSDGSLGCPQPGAMYTQALVDGYWIVVETNEQTFDYRLTVNGLIMQCEGTVLP